MQTGEILVFKYRGDTLIGSCQGEVGQKIKVSLGQNKILEFPSDRVVYRAGLLASDIRALDGFRSRVNALLSSVDLEEVWQVVKDEPGKVSMRDLAELYWGTSVSPEQYAALLLNLADNCPYFSEQNDGIVPVSDGAVTAALNQRAAQIAAKNEQTAFFEWILNPVPENQIELSNRQKLSLTRIREFALFGDDYEQAPQAKALLQEIKGETSGDLQRYAFTLMVNKGIWDADEHLDLVRYDVPVDFTEEVYAEARTLTPDESHRTDLTDLPVFSIDDASTRDVDDALSLEKLPGGYRLGVHITDVAAVIPVGSVVDEEARRRITTLYFPDRRIPMLPLDLSEETCSLLEGARRCAVSFLFDLDSDLNWAGVRIVPSIIINKNKRSYEEVDRILKDSDHPMAESMQILSQISDALLAQRLEHGAIELERAEITLHIDSEKHIEIEKRDTESTSSHIVSELMILANRTAGEYFADHATPAIYRTQKEQELKGVDAVIHKAVRRYLILRQLKPLELSLEPKPHATLGIDRYCQITSPMRRYADLVLQRQLVAVLQESLPVYDPAKIADEISRTERIKELNRILNRREWYWLLTYFNQQADLTIDAVVLDTRDREQIVDLTEYCVRGTIVPGAALAIGTEIKVRITHAEPWSGVLRLTVVH